MRVSICTCGSVLPRRLMADPISARCDGRARTSS
jgi:hypothetical protein